MPKLTSYCKFKSDFVFEQYLHGIANITNLTKHLIHALEIEAGKIALY